IEELDAPLLVCEPVLAESMHLLARFPKAQDALLGLLENGALAIASGLMNMSRSCAGCISSIKTEFRSLMRASFEWPKSTRGMLYSRSIPISRSIESMIGSP